MNRKAALQAVEWRKKVRRRVPGCDHKKKNFGFKEKQNANRFWPASIRVKKKNEKQKQKNNPRVFKRRRALHKGLFNGRKPAIFLKAGGLSAIRGVSGAQRVFQHMRKSSTLRPNPANGGPNQTVGSHF